MLEKIYSHVGKDYESLRVTLSADPAKKAQIPMKKRRVSTNNREFKLSDVLFKAEKRKKNSKQFK